DRGIETHELPGEEERHRRSRTAQLGEYGLRRDVVAAAVEGERDHMAARRQTNELAGLPRRRKREDQPPSPGSRTPSASARSAGTGSAAGRATSMTAP